tara:strand:+ start:112 stop:1095 length:984 start_codon:yes stop_codon:yes gene_type:complete
MIKHYLKKINILKKAKFPKSFDYDTENIKSPVLHLVALNKKKQISILIPPPIKSRNYGCQPIELTDSEIKFEKVKLKNKMQDDFFVITCLNDNKSGIFLLVISAIVKAIKKTDTAEKIYTLINKYIDFMGRSKFDENKLLGFWAELFLIYKSKNPDFLIQNWHQSNTDKLDFQEGNNGLEVKATSKDERIHHTSFSQLVRATNTILASFKLVQKANHGGLSIQDMIDNLNKRISISNQKKIANITLELFGGSNNEEYLKYTQKNKYNNQQAEKNLKFYNIKNIKNSLKNWKSANEIDKQSLQFRLNLTNKKQCSLKSQNKFFQYFII